MLDICELSRVPASHFLEINFLLSGEGTWTARLPASGVQLVTVIQLPLRNWHACTCRPDTRAEDVWGGRQASHPTPKLPTPLKKKLRHQRLGLIAARENASDHRLKSWTVLGANPERSGWLLLCMSLLRGCLE